MNTVGETKADLEIFLCEDQAEPRVFRLPYGTAVVFTTPRNGAEAPNQDAAAIIPYSDSETLLVVADGMGGTRNGAKAAAAVVNHLVESAPENGDDVHTRTAILDGIEAANTHILAEIPDGGTTLAVVEIRDALVRPYHIGDSSILVTGQRGKLKFNTIAHSPVGFAVEAGFLDEDEALYHRSRHLISNAVGLAGMRIELGAPLRLAPNDTLLLASDGLTDNLFLNEIIEVARKGPLDQVVASLAKLARIRMVSPKGEHPAKPDYLTIVAYRRSR
jgi:serine/threonine protein phosphatase PrpC